MARTSRDSGKTRRLLHRSTPAKQNNWGQNPIIQAAACLII
jgi:hypothetical protein